MSEQKIQPDIFYQIRNGTRGAAAMLAGMKLDIFTPLKDGAMSPQQLALKLGVNPKKLAPLLYTLVLTGLLTEKEGAFSNTPETDKYLVKGRAEYMGNVHKIWYSNLMATLKTAETIRSGIPQAEYDWKNMTKDELWVLYEGMAAPDTIFANKLSTTFDFSENRRLLDAGGGSGTLAIAMTKIHPQLTATVFDLPTVTPITEQFIRDLEASERVKVVSGDLTCDPIPGKYDVAFLSSVIQTLSAEEARLVIINVGKVINPGGHLFIFGSGMLDNSRLSPKAAVEFNLVFINTYDSGQSYTENEFTDWLNAAGFMDLDFRYNEFTIKARKSADK